MVRAVLMPWPAEFGRDKPRYGLVVGAAVFCVLGTLMFLTGFVAAVSEADALTAIFTGSGAVTSGLMLFAVPILWQVRRRELPALTHTLAPSGSALFLPADRKIQVSASGFLVGGSLWLACFVLLGMTRPDPDTEFDYMWNYAVLLAALAVCAFGGYAGWSTVRALRFRQGLTLGPDGLVMESGSTRQTTAWDDIGSVWPREDNHRHQVIVHSHRLTTVRRTRMVRRNGHTAREIRLDAAVLGIDPALLFYLICHYRTHPEHRRELRSTVAVARIRRGGLSLSPAAS